MIAYIYCELMNGSANVALRKYRYGMTAPNTPSNTTDLYALFCIFKKNKNKDTSSQRGSSTSHYIVQRLYSGLSGIRAGRSMLQGRFEAERPPASAEPPSSGRAVTLTSLSLLYSTGPHDPV